MEVDELVATLTSRDTARRPADAAIALTLVRRTLAGLDSRARSLRADVEGRPELLVPIEALEHELADLDAPQDADASGSPDGDDPALTRALDRGPGTGTIALPVGAVRSPTRPVPDGEATDTVAVPAPRRRRRRGLGWLVVLLVLLLAGGAAAWYFLLGPGSPVTVPDVTGAQRAAAERSLTDLELRVTTSERFDDDAPAGTVLETDPAAGTSLARGSDVAVVVSLGVEMLEVPAFTDLTREEAEAAITEAGLTAAPDVEETEDRTIPEGVVVASDPASGQVVAHDTPVRLTVSTGPRVVRIPENYGGKQAEVVQNDLVNLLDIPLEAITVTEVYSDDVPAGSVVSVTPAGGQEARQGDPAALEVSLGPELFEVPDVQGRQIGEATRILEDAGFTVEENNVLGGFFGTVRQQDVAAGEMRRRGTVITLTVV
ncbi:Stk1 family PASTA domain-containing Ser/Thr kinase [Litorihabitans aurantiacus]|nr:Stk1 family PASTA domain-containing Ser/Thr kinase [Litorihabitans aurantiacus]